MRKIISVALCVLAQAALLNSSHAEVSIPGYELVHTVPVETNLATPDLSDPITVWSQMFDSATEQIVIGQFYAASKPGSAFDKVIERLAAAGQRGVKIRFLMEEKGKTASEPSTIERLKQIPNLEFRTLDSSYSRFRSFLSSPNISIILNRLTHTQKMSVNKSK